MAVGRGQPIQRTKVSGFPLFRARTVALSIDRVPEFVIEQYVSRDSAAAVGRDAARARRVARRLSAEGAQVRYVRSFFLPEDETCFHLYQADTIDTVRDAARHARLPFERITPTITSGGR
jgi:Protein of unknown function (DUF4242)